MRLNHFSLTFKLSNYFSILEVQLTNDDLSFLMVKQETPPTLNSDEQLQENYIYDGETNPLVYEKYLDLNLRCNYEFLKYPFDQQQCSILVSFLLKQFIGLL